MNTTTPEAKMSTKTVDPNRIRYADPSSLSVGQRVWVIHTIMSVTATAESGTVGAVFPGTEYTAETVRVDLDEGGVFDTDYLATDDGLLGF